MICTIEACGNVAVARGWCDKHYTRWKRHRSPLVTKQDMHGFTNTPEYWVYKKMIRRCYDPKDAHYHRYGGRGIKVSKPWLDSVRNFISDMGRRPSDKHEVERIDNDGDYCAENCRWATRQEQMNNTVYNRIIEYRGVAKTMAQWARELDLDYTVFATRLRRGWPVERAVETPTNRRFTTPG